MAVAIVVARRLSILRAQEARRRREPARRPDRDSRRQARFERIMETAPTPMLHRELSPPPPPPRRPWACFGPCGRRWDAVTAASGAALSPVPVRLSAGAPKPFTACPGTK